MPLSKSSLSELRNYLLIHLGLNFSKDQEKILYDKVKLASEKFDFKEVALFVDWILRDSLTDHQLKQLSVFLTIGETYFFREKKALDYLELVHLPKFIREVGVKGKRKSLKIWSAGCATGEEPYSIAILLQRTIPDIQNWDITIVASDINPEFIKLAREGIYSNWSFRGLSQSFRSKYFEDLTGGRFQISQEIREMVTFKSLNLIKEAFYETQNWTRDMDVILCRNVMIYFSRNGINSVVAKFSKSLSEDGLFLVSPVEVSSVKNFNLRPVVYKGVTLFEKKSSPRLKVPKGFQSLESKAERLHGKHVVNSVVKNTMNSKVSQMQSSANKMQPQPFKIVKTERIKKVENEKSRYREAVKLYETGLLVEAEHLLEKMDVECHQDALLLWAMIKADTGKLEASEKMCNKVIASDKINFKAHVLLSTVLSEQGKLEEASKALKNSLFLNPDFSMGHFLLGNLAKQSGEHVECKKHFRNALKTLEMVKPDVVIEEGNGLTAARLTSIIKTID